MRCKVYIIGIDGATFRLIDPLIAQGKLPTFRSIIDNGVRGVLRSTLPPNSAVAWSTFMTGKNPGKHGVFGFLAFSPELNRLVLTNGAHVKSKTLWQIVSEASRPVAVLNVPFTYPPRPIQGVLVSGMDASFLKDFTYPPEFKTDLMNAAPGYQIDLPFIQNQSFQSELQHTVSRLIEARRQAMLYMLDKIDPDLFIGVFTCTDRLQHHFWHCIDPKHPKHHVSQSTEAAVLTGLYEQIDDTLQLIVNRMDEQTTLLIISDHGFCGVAQRFLINRWLAQTGWLRLKANVSTSPWARLLRTVKRHPMLYEFAKQIKRSSLGLTHIPVRARAMTRSFFDRIDWRHTRAYYFPPGIRLNVKGRESLGIIEADAYESTRDLLIEQLSSLHEPTLGAPIFAAVHRREELYCGPHVAQAPDIILETVLTEEDPRRNFTLGRRLKAADGEPLFITDAPSGDHGPDGILLGMGPHLTRHAQPNGATIADIAPTVLYELGLPIPKDMDGRVLTELFTNEFLSQRPPTFSDQDGSTDADTWQYDEVDEVIMRQRLHDLGYLS